MGKLENMGSMIASGVITFVLACGSAVVFFFMLMLAINGFMGQERAVNASFGTYAFLGGMTILAATALSVVVSRLLQRRFGWHAVLAVLLSSTAFSIAACLSHLICVIISAIVASEMRTVR